MRENVFAAGAPPLDLAIREIVIRSTHGHVTFPWLVLLSHVKCWVYIRIRVTLRT